MATRLSGAWVGLLALPLWGQSEGPLTRDGRYWVQTVSGTVSGAPGGRLRLDSVGSIRVRGEGGNETRYTARKRVRADSEAEARRYFAAAPVRASRQGSSVVVTAEHPGCQRCSYTTELEIQTPRSTQETILRTRGGSIEVYDMEGRVTAETAGGSVQMDRIGQSVRATTAGGSITLGGIGGPVRCETAGGSIRLGSARGEAVLTTNGGSIDADQVDGPLRAETAGGNIRAGKVNGDVIAETAGGSIYLSQVNGTVTAETAGGSITVEGARGVRAENAGGSIKLIDVAGVLRAATAAGNILALLTAHQSLADSLLETSMGNIEVVIPATLKLTIRADVEVAGSTNRIQCDFPDVRVYSRDQGPGPRAVVAEGAINGGGPVLRIRNTSGNIQIKRR